MVGLAFGMDAAGTGAATATVAAAAAAVLAALAAAVAAAAPTAAATGAGTTAGLSIGNPGVLAADAAGAAAAAAGAADVAGAPAILFKSPMFFDNSATRVVASLACLSLAILSSVAVLPCKAPLDNVSLSGVTAAPARSSTLACTLPPVWRLALSTCVIDAPSASFCRKSLKSFACATMILEASGPVSAPASPADGRFSTAPALKRLMLSPTNASGLLTSNATSIWSSEILAGLFCVAILLAVSPAFTVTCWPVATGLERAGIFSLAIAVLDFGGTGCAGAAGRIVVVGWFLACGAAAAIGVLVTAGRAIPVPTEGAVAVTAPACRRLGGSNSMV